MKKRILLGLMVGFVMGMLQLLVPYVIVRPCPDVSAFDACGSTIDATFYRGWPFANEGGVGIGYRYDQPPLTWHTFANIAIIIALAVCAALVVYFVARRVRLSKTSRRVLLAAVVLGVGLGVAQLFYMQLVTRQFLLFDMTNVMHCDQKIAGCGYCPEERKSGNFCNLGTFQQQVRGWPLTHETYDKLSQYDITPKLMLNAVILTAGAVLLAVLGMGIAKLVSK